MPSRWFGLTLSSVLLAGGWLALAELGFQDTIHVQNYHAVVVAAAIGGGLGWFGRLRWPVAVTGAVFAGLLAVQWFSWPASLAHGLVRSDPLPAAPADAIVGLSASLTDDGVLSPTAATRLLEGARLYRAGTGARLVLSRVTALEETERAVDSDRDQRAVLRAAGVTPELHVLSPVRTTRLEAVRMAELAKPRGWHRIVVVTSPTHTRRACAVFEAVGFDVVCRPSPEREFALEHLAAGGDRSRAFGQWVYETLGWWEYRVRGWVRN